MSGSGQFSVPTLSLCVLNITVVQIIALTEPRAVHYNGEDFAAKVKQIKGMEGQEEGKDFDDKCGACGRDTTGMKVSKYKYKYRSL